MSKITSDVEYFTFLSAKARALELEIRMRARISGGRCLVFGWMGNSEALALLADKEKEKTE